MRNVTTPRPWAQRLRRRSTAVVCSLLVAASLAACGGGETEGGADPQTSETASGESAYLDTPEGVTLTEPGTELSLGDAATVAWEPREGTNAVLDLTVDRIERTTFDESFQGWKIDDQTAALTPYFVRATATNVSGEDLGGTQVLLWGRDDSGTLVAPQGFTKKVFEPCPSADLPETFADGDTAQVCFVYLIAAGRELTAAAFPPPGQASPVLWSGKVSTKVQPPQNEGAQDGKNKKAEKKSKDRDDE